MVMAVISRCLFQSTLPARGATVRRVMSVPASTNFNPRSPHGERRHTDAAKAQEAIFQSTLPARGATSPDADGFHARAISIHAPRTGSDERYFTIQYASLDFNPRSPHGERRNRCCVSGAGLSFQSTLPARGATRAFCAKGRGGAFQSTLPARGATRRPTRPATSGRPISIHAPRTGSDRPRAGARQDADISIHAPRTGSDRCQGACTPYRAISIHAPRTGSDDPRAQSFPRKYTFQSTLPARGATKKAYS